MLDGSGKVRKNRKVIFEHWSAVLLLRKLMIPWIVSKCRKTGPRKRAFGLILIFICWDLFGCRECGKENEENVILNTKIGGTKNAQLSCLTPF